MFSLTRIAQFHGYLYESLGEDKQRTLVRVEHKVAVSVAAPGSTQEEMIERTSALAKVTDAYFAARFHDHLMIRANEPVSANHYMQNRQEFKGLYISPGENSALALSQELLRSPLEEKLYAAGLLLYRVLVRRSDRDAQYATRDVTEAITKYAFGVESGNPNTSQHLKKMLRPIGEDLPTRSRRKRNF